MYRSSAQLSAYLAIKYLIPIDRKHFIGHNEVPDPNHPGIRRVRAPHRSRPLLGLAQVHEPDQGLRRGQRRRLRTAARGRLCPDIRPPVRRAAAPPRRRPTLAASPSRARTRRARRFATRSPSPRPGATRSTRGGRRCRAGTAPCPSASTRPRDAGRSASTSGAGAVGGTSARFRSPAGRARRSTISPRTTTPGSIAADAVKD